MRQWLMNGLGALVLLGFVACQVPSRDPGVDAQIRQVFDSIRTGQAAALTDRLDSSIRTPETQAQLVVVAGYIPRGEPRQRKMLGTNTVHSGSETTVSTTDEYDYGDRVALVNTRLSQTNSAGWRITNFHVQVATRQELSANDFTFQGKPAANYLAFGLLIGSLAAMVAALVKVIRTPGLKRKWLWGIAAFFGVGLISLNWTTGQFNFNPLTLQLIGAGVAKAPSLFAPWILSFTLPVGALLILFGVWANPARAKKPAEMSPSPEPPAQT